MFEPRNGRAEEFLSSEDLELATLSWAELMALWDFWLAQAQSTNEADHDDYSHGVFVSPRRAREILSGDTPQEIACRLDALDALVADLPNNRAQAGLSSLTDEDISREVIYGDD